MVWTNSATWINWMAWANYHFGIANRARISPHRRDHSFHQENTRKPICATYTIKICVVSFRSSISIRFIKMVTPCSFSKLSIPQLQIVIIVHFHHVSLHFDWTTGIPADYYSVPENVYGDSGSNVNNSCFDTDGYKAPKGLQNISPCQYSTNRVHSTHCI